MRNSYHGVCRIRVTNIQYQPRFEHTWCSGIAPTEIGNFAWETSRPVSPTIVSLVVTWFSPSQYLPRVTNGFY